MNYSFKYNMNGGSCSIHLMPSGSGTAVNMRFSIAQATGARYGRYAEDLNAAMQKFLPVVPRPATYNMDDFLIPANQVTPAGIQRPAAPVAAPAPAPAPAAAGYCVNCGSALAVGGRFCSKCGTAVTAPPIPRCPNCGAQANPGAAFCTQCGAKLHGATPNCL